MSRATRRGFIIAASLALLSAPVLPANAASTGRYVVVLRDDAEPQAEARDHGRRYGVQAERYYRSVIKGYSARVPEHRVSDLRNDPSVTAVARDFTVKMAAQTTPTGVRRIGATVAGTGDGVNIAVMDTGVDSSHPDLAANIAGGINCTSRPNGFNDEQGHGTHVAGILAAVDNTVGVRGVAPEASLWSVRVLDHNGAGTLANLLCGLDFIDNNSPANDGVIEVANLSLEAEGDDDGNCGLTIGDPLHQAICALVSHGVTVVAAAGNLGEDLQGTVPAAYDEVITVTALADSDGLPCGAGPNTLPGYPDDTFASFSNFATLSSDLAHVVAAPGVDILSTIPGGLYQIDSGTSMASPHVAAAAARIIAADPTATPASILATLKAQGEPPGVNFGGECTSGVSHTNADGLDPEPVIRIRPAAVTFLPPTTLTGPVRVAFPDIVSPIDATNLVIRTLGSNTNLPASVTFNGGLATAFLQPSSPLTPGGRYTVIVAPPGSTPPEYPDGTDVPQTTGSFRASLNEEERSVAARYYWRRISTSSALGSEYHTEKTRSASIYYTFTGTSVTWYTVRGPDQGNAEIQIDGISRGIVNNYRSSTQYRYQRAFSGLSPGTHTFRVIVSGTKDSRSRDYSVAVDAFRPGTAAVDVNPVVRSVWRLQSTTGASGGRVHTSRLTNTQVYFTFSGTGVVWYTMRGRDQGIARVYVDGVSRGTFDNYRSSPAIGSRSFSGLADGLHTLRIVVTGTKRSAATNTYVNIDRFRVI